ncbi:unnamed protein product [Angiostrongylus costaricensis]|uniref:Tudor domain-containing protein n=1 Tax=Angiostrongylus costaricensis TaxID=334426 RepID=A0A158PL49_ANGCS|nr:unnamed protein product [Angiostrongylus costaricensis]
MVWPLVLRGSSVILFGLDVVPLFIGESGKSVGLERSRNRWIDMPIVLCLICESEYVIVEEIKVEVVDDSTYRPFLKKLVMNGNFVAWEVKQSTLPNDILELMMSFDYWQQDEEEQEEYEEAQPGYTIREKTFIVDNEGTVFETKFIDDQQVNGDTLPCHISAIGCDLGQFVIPLYVTQLLSVEVELVLVYQ